MQYMNYQWQMLVARTGQSMQHCCKQNFQHCHCGNTSGNTDKAYSVQCVATVLPVFGIGKFNETDPIITTLNIIIIVIVAVVISILTTIIIVTNYHHPHNHHAPSPSVSPLPQDQHQDLSTADSTTSKNYTILYRTIL